MVRCAISSKNSSRAHISSGVDPRALCIEHQSCRFWRSKHLISCTLTKYPAVLGLFAKIPKNRDDHFDLKFRVTLGGPGGQRRSARVLKFLEDLAKASVMTHKKFQPPRWIHLRAVTFCLKKVNSR